MLEIDGADPNYMQSLARGLSVLSAFGQLGPSITVSRIASETGLSRAVVARCLYTLKRCGYVEVEEGRYSTKPHVLSLAHSYLSDDSLPTRAQPVLEELRDAFGESCSLGVLDGTDVVYIARASVSRIMAIALHVGSRLPAHRTSMGRVLLAALADSEIEEHLARADMSKRTRFTIATSSGLRAELRRVAAQGFSLVEQELEMGLRSIGVPVHGRNGRVVASVNVGANAARTSVEDLTGATLERLRYTARAIERLA